MAKKKFDPKAKAKKQKMIAIGGAVLLLLVLGIEAPATMKKLSAKTPPPPVVSTGPTTTTPGVTPTGPLTPPSLDGSSPATPVAVDPSATGSSLAAAAPEGTIASFDRFASKDPFNQQVKPTNGAGAGTTATRAPITGAGAGATPVAPIPPTVTPIPPGGTVPIPTPTGTPTVPAGPLPTVARIAINGVAEDVGVGKDFPAANPTFHLVALTRKGAKIAVAGGSYTNGAPTVTLLLHKTLNLQNTSDGTVFTLRLVMLDPLSSAATATPLAPVTTTPTTTTTDTATGLSP